MKFTKRYGYLNEIIFHLFTAFLWFLLIISESSYVFAGDFETYMKVWDEKRGLATEYLMKAEKSLKEGDKTNGCANQRKASQYGIEATQSLIKAMKINGSEDGFEGLASGLNKWRELGDFCE